MKSSLVIMQIDKMKNKWSLKTSQDAEPPKQGETGSKGPGALAALAGVRGQTAEQRTRCVCSSSPHTWCSLFVGRPAGHGADGAGSPGKAPRLAAGGSWSSLPQLCCNSCVSVFSRLAVGPPSIIRKFIFSFNNLWLLFPFTDGVTNYFIIGFFKTSYLLFGSISETPTWLSLILMVGLPGGEPDGEYSRIISRFSIYYCKVAHRGSCPVSGLCLEHTIALFCSWDGQRTSSTSPWSLELGN